MKFNSLKDMNKYVNSQMKEIAQDQLAEKILLTLRDFVESTVYANEPNQYERTYQLLNSLTIGKAKAIGTIITCSVYFDADKITQSIATNRWNQHMSIYGYERRGGEPINELIPYFLNDGTDSPIYSHESHDFVEKTIESLNNGSLRQELIKFLKQRGIVAT